MITLDRGQLSEIVKVVDADGTLRYASFAFGRILGYDPGEAVGTMYALELTGYPPEDLLVGGKVKLGGLIVEEDRGRVWDEVQETLDGGRGFRGPISDHVDLAGQAAARTADRVIRRLEPRILVVRRAPCVPGQGCAVLMHPRDRRIDRDHPIQSSSRVGLPLHLGQQSLPGAVSGPPDEPLIDRVPLPEPLRHVPPGRTRAVLPRYPLDGEPVIGPWTRPPRHCRHQWLQHSPYFVRNLATHHPERVCRAGPKTT